MVWRVERVDFRVDSWVSRVRRERWVDWRSARRRVSVSFWGTGGASVVVAEGDLVRLGVPHPDREGRTGAGG